MNPPESHLDLLERPLFAHFATVAASGAPLVNPMWFLWDGEAGRIKLTHVSTRHNYRHLQREPRVAFSIIDPESGYRYLQVRGEVETIEPDPTGAFFQVLQFQVLQQRYLGRTGEVADRAVRVVITVRPTGFLSR
jgi:PPOX class probable F420-dependent enzyme